MHSLWDLNWEGPLEGFPAGMNSLYYGHTSIFQSLWPLHPSIGTWGAEGAELGGSWLPAPGGPHGNQPGPGVSRCSQLDAALPYGVDEAKGPGQSSTHTPRLWGEGEEQSQPQSPAAAGWGGARPEVMALDRPGHCAWSQRHRTGEPVSSRVQTSGSWTGPRAPGGRASATLLTAHCNTTG